MLKNEYFAFGFAEIVGKYGESLFVFAISDKIIIYFVIEFIMYDVQTLLAVSLLAWFVFKDLHFSFILLYMTGDLCYLSLMPNAPGLK